MTRHTGDFTKFSNGFTLAEVLITLGVIGIVAALTMPALIANYQKKRTVTQLKATYSILAQAFERAKADYGDMENWGMDSIYGQTSGADKIFKEFTETYFVPYVKPVQNYGITTLKNIGYEKDISLLDGSSAYKSVNINSSSYILILPNGTITSFRLDDHCDEIETDSSGNNVCVSERYYTSIYIIADINGLKKPNTVGKDIFVMAMQSNKFGFYNYTSTANNRTWLLKSCSKGSIENRHCGRLIQYDGWEINYDW